MGETDLEVSALWTGTRVRFLAAADSGGSGHLPHAGSLCSLETSCFLPSLPVPWPASDCTDGSGFWCLVQLLTQLCRTLDPYFPGFFSC